MPLKDGLFHADGHPYVNDHHEDRPYSSRSPNIQPSDQPSPSAFGADANIEELARQRQCDAVLLQVQLEALGIRHRHPIEPTLGKSYPYKPYVKPPRSRSQEKRSHISMQMEHYNSCAWTGKQVEDIVPYNEPTGLGASGLDAPTRPWVSSRDPPALPFGPEEYMKREAEQLEKVERSEAEFWASVRCGGRITDVADQRYLRSPSPKPTARKPKSEEEMIKAWNGKCLALPIRLIY